MTFPSEPSDSVQSLLAKVQANPNDWVVRKEVAAQLYEEGAYLDAADTVWNAPEMPSTDVDVAFAVKIVSRARPNRSIRLVYEVLRRNEGKPEQNLAMARAFSLIGLPMLASRFYGAALASDANLFDIGFEQESLWLDDSGSLLAAWEASATDIKKPFSKPITAFLGDAIQFSEIKEVEPTAAASVAIQQNVPKPASLGARPVLKVAQPPVVNRPLVEAPKPTAPVPQTHPSLMVPAKNAPKPMLPPGRNPD